eukprot:7719647-Heterocapsa_arctica.AAC.1
MEGIAAYPWMPRGVQLPAADINDQHAMKEVLLPPSMLRRYDRHPMDLTFKLMQYDDVRVDREDQDCPYKAVATALEHGPHLQADAI